MQTLQSYVVGQWMAGSGQGSTLENPTTGESVATCSTEGVDFGAVVRHAPNAARCGAMHRARQAEEVCGVLARRAASRGSEIG